MPFVENLETRLFRSGFPITAVSYADGAKFEICLQDLAGRISESGMRLAGLIQHRQPRAGRVKCDLVLRDLATGGFYPISDDRGAHARGCMLNTDLLLRACEAAASGLTGETNVLVLSKFGKTEAEGGGARALIATALDLGVPVLIGVPLINLGAFREFAGELAQVIEFQDAGFDPTGEGPPASALPARAPAMRRLMRH